MAARGLRNARGRPSSSTQVAGDTFALGGPRRARKSRQQGEPRLFGMHVPLEGTFGAGSEPSLESLVRLATLGGADVWESLDVGIVDLEHDAAPPFHAVQPGTPTRYVLVDAKSPRGSRTRPRDVPAGAVQVAPVRWMFDCISHFRIVPMEP